MTVHQAKGLEFDIVVLPDLLGSMIEGHESFSYRRPDVESDIDLVCRYVGKDSGRPFLPTEFWPLFEEYEDRSARESLCVLYVALTRAAHALHVFLPSGMDGIRGSKGHPGFLINDAFLEGQKLEPGKTMFAMGDAEWFRHDEATGEKQEDLQDVTMPEPRFGTFTQSSSESRDDRAESNGHESIPPNSGSTNAKAICCTGSRFRDPPMARTNRVARKRIA